MIFVTGGTGLLGNCIIRELCARQIPCRVLCRQGTPRTALEGLEIEIIEGDLHDTRTLEAAARGCQAVVHSAAMIHIGWQQLEESRQVNVAGTQNVIDACIASGVRLIHISTVDTLPAAVDLTRPIDETGTGGLPKVACSYVISKTESEQAVRRAIQEVDLDAVIVHPGFMLGPFDWKPSSGRMFLEVTRAPVVAAPPGGCSVCDARDVAAATVNALELGRVGDSYILAGENLSYRDLWTQMLRVAGRRRRVFPLGGGVQWIGKGIDRLNRLGARREGDVNGASIAMGALRHYYASDKARAQIGYQNRPLEETLQDAWSWLALHHPRGGKG